MSKIRDHLQSMRGEYWNRRNRNAIARGKNPRRARVAAEIKSRTPIYRDRINPAHGNKHREDARLHRSGNESLARMRRARDGDPRDIERVTHGSINRDQFPATRPAPQARTERRPQRRPDPSRKHPGRAAR